MANTFSAALVTDTARDTAITILQNRLAMLRGYSRDFSTDELAPLKNVQVPLVSAGSTGVVNPTTYSGGNSTISNVPVAVNELHVPFTITSQQINQGFRLEQLYTINLQVLANMIVDAALTPVTVANYGAAACAAVTAPNFGADDLTVLFGAAKNFNVKNLILDGSYLAQFIPTDKFKFALGEQGAFGFDMIAMNNRWSAAGANVQGFVADPQAIACASGLAQIHDAVKKLLMIDEVITIESLGISIKFNVWGSADSRAVFGSYGVMFGAAKGDVTALKLITSA